MKNVIIGVLLMISGAAVVAWLLLSQQYPPELPENFWNAPIKIVCTTEEPLAIHANFYINQPEGWAVAIMGRHYTNFYVILENQRGGKKEITEWAKFANYEWVNLKDLEKEWQEYYSAANKLFTFPEKLFFRRCFNQQIAPNLI